MGRPDGKTQVTIEYLQHPDGSVEPKKIHTVVISTQHAEPLKAKRTKECAGYKGPEMTAPSMEAMNKEIEEKVIKRTLQNIKLKNGQAAITLYGSHTHLHINPSGKFIKFFEWENAKDLKKYSSMNSDQVSAALKSSNFLTKWVD